MCYNTPTDVFRQWGVSLVIWANHNMRACVSAMQQVSSAIYKDQSLTNIENTVRFLSYSCCVTHLFQ